MTLSPEASAVLGELQPYFAQLAADIITRTLQKVPQPQIEQGTVVSVDDANGRAFVRYDTPAPDGSEATHECDVATSLLPAVGDRVFVTIWPPAGPLILGTRAAAAVTPNASILAHAPTFVDEESTYGTDPQNVIVLPDGSYGQGNELLAAKLEGDVHARLALILDDDNGFATGLVVSDGIQNVPGTIAAFIGRFQDIGYGRDNFAMMWGSPDGTGHAAVVSAGSGVVQISSPRAACEVDNDVELLASPADWGNLGLIATSPDGTRWRLTPDDAGASVWTAL